MKTKIVKIKDCKTCKEVLIFLNRTEEGGEIITIIAWHENKDGDFIQTEQIECHNHLMCCQIICDFSEFTANSFANSMRF